MKTPFSDTPVLLKDPGDRLGLQINTSQGFYALQQVPNPDVLVWPALEGLGDVIYAVLLHVLEYSVLVH